MWWIVTNKLEGMWKEAVAKQSDALSRQVLGRTEDVTAVWGMQMSGPSFEPKILTFQEGGNADNWTATLNLGTHQTNPSFSWRVYFLLKLVQQLQCMCKYIRCSQTIIHIPRDTIETAKHFSRTAIPFISSAVKQCNSRGVLVNFTRSACGLTAH